MTRQRGLEPVKRMPKVRRIFKITCRKVENPKWKFERAEVEVGDILYPIKTVKQARRFLDVELKVRLKVCRRQREQVETFFASVRFRDSKPNIFNVKLRKPYPDFHK